MKVKREMMALTFGEFIMAMYDARGRHQANGIIRLAIEARLIVFPRKNHLRISQVEPQRPREPVPFQ